MLSLIPVMSSVYVTAVEIKIGDCVGDDNRRNAKVRNAATEECLSYSFALMFVGGKASGYLVK